MAIFIKKLLMHTSLVLLLFIGLYFVFLFISSTIANDERNKKIQKLESEIKTLKEHSTELEKTTASCSATLQACLGSCVESQLLDVVKESIRIKR